MFESVSARLKSVALSIAFIVVAVCVLRPPLLAQPHQGFIANAPSAKACQARANDTPEKLLECIQTPSLWSHLAHFQKISDEHKGADGHGNRDTGTAGYKASVDYVAKLMRAAGYHVTIQTYQINAAEVTGVPKFGLPDPSYALTRDWPPTASIVDYNLIAESPFGDPNHTVVVDAHLDSIFGAGMLDNASGSTTILEIALNMAKTQTRNRLRYIWFGGEEIGLFGSTYYTTTLSQAQRKRIAFDIDMDVTATPNFDMDCRSRVCLECRPVPPECRPPVENRQSILQGLFQLRRNRLAIFLLREYRNRLELVRPDRHPGQRHSDPPGLLQGAIGSRHMGWVPRKLRGHSARQRWRMRRLSRPLV